MKVIGLAGRAGCGKSAVAQYLARTPGIEWVDLDRVAWDTYAAGTPTFARLLAAFGNCIVDDSGQIDRRQLAAAAFANLDSQDTLNAIVHPAVSAALGMILGQHRQKGTEILLVEGALLASSPHVDRSIYDLILWLDAAAEVRGERLRAIGRGAHATRGDGISPSGDYVAISAAGTIEQVAERVLRAIAGNPG